MSPLLLLFANGDFFFVGLGLVVFASLQRLRATNRIFGFLLAAVWMIGICLTILSATPMPLWLYACWLGLGVALIVIFNVPAWSHRRTFIVGLFSLMSLGLALLELPYHLPPKLSILPNHPIFILGDSISAGIRTKVRLWPDVLSDRSHLQVINLAHPGATLESALNQTSGIADSDSVAILEIGGNDLLREESPELFYTQLDALLKDVKGKTRHLAMFELPLFPFWNEYGRAQRVLAHKYRVVLIPKSYLTHVFELKGGTVDGLHLSQEGHNALAESIAKLLKVEQKP